MKKKKNRSQRELLSADELSMLNAEIKNSGEDRSQLPPHDTSDRANAIRFAKKNPIFIASAAVIVLLLIAALIFGGIMFAQHLSARPNTSAFTVYLGTESYEVPYDEAPYDEVSYDDAAYESVPYGDFDAGTNASPIEPNIGPTGQIEEDPAALQAMLQASFGDGVVFSEAND